jgi:hypothetical protein
VVKKVFVGIRVAEAIDSGLKLFAPKKVALVGLNAPHFIEGCHEGSACHFSILVDNDINADFGFEKHAKDSSRLTAAIVTEGHCFFYSMQSALFADPGWDVAEYWVVA